MANLRQDRAPDPTLAHTSANPNDGSAVNGRPGSPRSVVLSLRLRTMDSSGAPADVSWSPSALAHSPAAALCFDVLAASGGAPDPAQNTVLTARFSNLQSALLAARRLQWAVEGLADAAGSAISAAIAVQSLESQDGAEVSPSLETATPGVSVRVTSTIAEALQHLPGISMRNTGEGDWREVHWLSPAASNPPADEQAVLSLIQALGRQDPCAAQPERPGALKSQAVAAAEATTGVHPAPGMGRSHVEPTSASGLGKRKWLIFGGAAAVIVVVAILVIPAIFSGGHPKASPQTDTLRPAAPPNTSTAAPAPNRAAGPSSPPDQSPGTALRSAGDQKTPAKTTKPSKWEPKAEPKTEPQPALKPSGSCELTEAEIPRSLTRAENLMYAGKLDDAQDAFQHLLSCPSAHERAAAGLQRVKQRMATQGISGP